eukprot:746987-Hanusia_phi.AAC.5
MYAGAIDFNSISSFICTFASEAARSAVAWEGWGEETDRSSSMEEEWMTMEVKDLSSSDPDDMLMP